MGTVAETCKKDGVLSPSWPSPEILATMLDQASGQFIYAATIIRYLTISRHGNPHTLLDRVLEVKPTSPGINPFSHLDACYNHILQSAPDPRPLAVKWLWIIKGSLPQSRFMLFTIVPPLLSLSIYSFKQTKGTQSMCLETYTPRSTHPLPTTWSHPIGLTINPCTIFWAARTVAGRLMSSICSVQSFSG
jgi:hypothetical protein